MSVSRVILFIPIVVSDLVAASQKGRDEVRNKPPKKFEETILALVNAVGMCWDTVSDHFQSIANCGHTGELTDPKSIQVAFLAEP